MILINRADQRRNFGHGNFKVNVTFPGVNIDPATDPGLLNLGRFDHAVLKPGAFISMHRHQNDEILSLLKTGTMQHRDTAGNVVQLSEKKLMMMNSGAGILHEERVPEGSHTGDVEMLQIFIRPRVKDAPPLVQFAQLPDNVDDVWRLVGGPAQVAAPLEIRSDIIVYDLHAPDEVTDLALPITPFPETTYLLYLFAGEMEFGTDRVLSVGDSIVIRDEHHFSFSLGQRSIVVAFVMNNEADYTLDGMFSGVR